jgi:3-hydroxyisobutyrate dehydrogenase-like beta-hydroxyacid dehydrogenase
MPPYRGLILGFGVVTTDFYGALSAFSVRAGLDPEAFVHALRETDEGRDALAAVEPGQMAQRDFERTMGRLLGLDDDGLLAHALADLHTRPEVVALVRQARGDGVRTAARSNSRGTDAAPSAREQT